MEKALLLLLDFTPNDSRPLAQRPQEAIALWKSFLGKREKGPIAPETLRTQLASWGRWEYNNSGLERIANFQWMERENNEL